ncbi:MAG: MBL fold metallo-hydrolase [Deltaproteobacteria bacterium]|nr:MBL fold metallo-hydrolase [Deltaproteobacteria bacterium]
MIETEQRGPVRKFILARTILGQGRYFTSAYWVDGLMIDTGCAYTAAELLASLNKAGVEQVVNTHCHEDHIGANAALQERYGAQIWAHPLALPVLAAPDEQQPLTFYRWLLWGHAAPSQGQAIGSSLETEHHRFDILHTPGHSPDHICLYEPDQGWLFVGDAFVGGQDRILRRGSNIWQIIDSLKRLAALEVSFLFPGSGRVRSRPRAELQAKIEYLEETGHQVLRLSDQGLSVDQIRRRLFGRESMITLLSLGDLSGAHLVRSYLDNRPETN